MYTAMQHVTALQASLTGYLIPIFAVVLGAVWLGERVGLALLAGGALIFVGVTFLADILKVLILSLKVSSILLTYERS